MPRPRIYPTYPCPTCGAQLVRHKGIYHNCPACLGHFKDIGGSVVEVRKREPRCVGSWSRGSFTRYLDADEFERLAG